MQPHVGRHVAGVHFIYQFLCDKQNSKDVPQDTCPLSIQSNTNLGTAIKGFCRCNEAIKSVDFKYGDYPGECGGAKLITCVL